MIKISEDKLPWISLQNRIDFDEDCSKHGKTDGIQLSKSYYVIEGINRLKGLIKLEEEGTVESYTRMSSFLGKQGSRFL